MLNEVTREYLRLCETEGSPLRDAGLRAPYLPEFLAGYGGLIVARPMFVNEADLRRAAEDVAGAFDLVASLPDRLFDGDMRRYGAAIGMDQRSIDVMSRGATGAPPRNCRADMIYDGTSFKMLELNAGSELGGSDTYELNRGVLEVNAFREFADRHQLSYVSTGSKINEVLRKVAEPVTGGRDPVVAVIEWTGGLVPATLYQSFQAVMAAEGLEVLLAEVHQVSNQNGKLYFEGRPIDVALRYFTLTQACADPNAEALIDPILRAHDAGGTVLYAHLETTRCAYKDNLAMLSDVRNRHAFSAAEAALIDRVLPWTRRLEAGPTEVEGETVDLIRYCLAHREHLILKPHAGLGGYGAVAGWDVTDEEWAKTLADSGQGAFLVQRRLVPDPEPVMDPETGEVEDWNAISGIFVTPAGFAGDFPRLQPVSGKPIISYGNGCRTTSVFMIPQANSS